VLLRVISWIVPGFQQPASVVFLKIHCNNHRGISPTVREGSGV